MPEFILNTGSTESARAFSALDAFTQGYIEALFFTDEAHLCEESGREMPEVAIDLATMESRFVGGDSPGFGDLAPETLAKIIADCTAFQTLNYELLATAYATREGLTGEYNEAGAGRDFWYTRNGHGVGFWDRGLGDIGDKLVEACGWRTAFPQVDSYVGDDGKVYL